MEEEIAALVVDNGSGMCKAGFAGDDAHAGLEFDFQWLDGGIISNTEMDQHVTKYRVWPYMFSLILVFPVLPKYPSDSLGKALESHHWDPISRLTQKTAGQLALFARSAFYKLLF